MRALRRAVFCGVDTRARVTPRAGGRDGGPEVGTPATSPGPASRNVTIAVGLLAAVAFVYGQTSRHGFVSYDDAIAPLHEHGSRARGAQPGRPRRAFGNHACESGTP